MIIASGMIVTLYLGGWQVPYIDKLGSSTTITTIIQVAAFLFKMEALLFFFIWVRWSIPRFRYDQLMNLVWKVMFPLALANLIWVALLIMIFNF